MGTKIQGNAYMREYHSVIDLNGDRSRGTRPLYHENEVPKNDESPADLYDQEKVRQTILEHESIFRNQLQELHRLYGRQRELMNEIRSKDGVKEEKGQLFLFSQNLLEDARKPRDPYHSSSSRGCLPISGTRFTKLPFFESSGEKKNHTDNRFSHIINGVQMSQHKADSLTFYSKRNDNAGDVRPRGEISSNSCANFGLATKDFFPGSVDRMNGDKSPSILGLWNERRGNEQLSDGNAEKMRFDKPLFPQSLLAEPRKEFSNGWLDMGASVSRKRKKIFGVEISEENDDQITAAAAASKMFDQKDENDRAFSSSWIDNSFMQSLHLRGTNSRKAEMKCELISSKERFSNQQNTSDPNSYFKNVDNRKKDSQLPWFLRNSQAGDDQNETKKETSSCYFMNLDSLQNSSQKFFGKAVQTSNENDGKKIPISDGGVSSLKHCIDLNLSLDEEDQPYEPTDLEASIVIESETDASPKEDESSNLDEECAKIAAEAMVAISLSPKSASDDSLKWFAEIISSGESSSVPDGIDYFEYMTLKLEDTKNYEPLVSNNVSDNETGGMQTTKRCRRRGRQRKDFQRDILPGLVTLSRLQVTEDFQAFDQLLKAGGSSQRRNGKGRRRPTAVKALCSTEAQQPICQLEERSLAGWGKRTRRLPRQRCTPNTFLSFPVKC